MSLQKWKKKKEKALAEGKLEDIYHTCIELAELYFSEENYKAALQEYKEAEIAAAADDNTINSAVAHRMIGQVYSSMQEHTLAIEHQKKVPSGNDEVEEQRALATMGQTYFLKADSFVNPHSIDKAQTLEMAKKYYMKSLQVCERLTNVKPKEHMEMKGRLYLNLGLVMDEQNQLERAVDYLLKAVYVCKSMDLWDILYRSYHSLASLYHKQRNHSLALQNYDKALDVAQRLSDKTILCDLLLLKGEVLFDLPDFRGSKQALLKAYKMNTKNREEVEKKLRIVAAVNKFEEQLLEVSDQDLVQRKLLYESMGDGCVAMKNFPKALEYYFLMLKTAEDLGESGDKLKPCYISLSQTYKDNKQYDLAIEYFNREFQLCVNNPEEACRTTLNIADILEIKEASVDEIITMYRRALTLAQKAGNVKLEHTALACIVRVFQDNRMQSDSVEYEEKLKNIEKKLREVESSDSDSEEENTPDIGADICLDILTDTEVDEGEGTVRAAKKKRTAFHFKRNEKGETPLHTACISGNLTLVQKLLDQGHPVDIRDNNGWLPLHEACNFGHTEIVKLLLDKGASINDRGTAACGGMTPLLDAASCGNLSVMEVLLERGASPVMRTNKGETVLDCLTAWRERYKQEEHCDLDPETLSYYHEMVRMLRAAIEKAGHKPMGEVSEISSTLFQRRNRRSAERRCSVSPPRSLSSSKHRSTESNQLRRSGESRSEGRKEITQKESSTSEYENAATEYENAIKALRHRPKQQTHQIYTKHEEKSALLNQNEVVDDWLIDDLELTGRGVKRRRGHCFEGQTLRKSHNWDYSQGQSLRKSSGERSCNFRVVSPVASSSSESDVEPSRVLTNRKEPSRINSEDSSNYELSQLVEAMEENIQESEDINLTSQFDSDDATPVRSSSNKLSLSRKRQVSLLAAGVSRQIVPQHMEQVQRNTSTMPSSQRNRTSPPETSQSQLVPCQSVKVRIEQKLFLVPLPSNQDTPLTVAWLAQEAARRYYCLEGVEPKLSLLTEDGALLAPDDPVTLLLTAPEVHASVIAWNLAPLTQRYREACVSLKTDLDDHIEWSLDACQATTNLDLTDCALLPVQLKPAIKALAHHYTLQHLNLSGNQLGDEGVQMLSECVMKLTQLRQLDLSCNCISLEGFSHLAQQASQHRGLQTLEILDFSHNPLGEDCLRPLDQILKCAPGLNTLYLAAVEITPASFRGCLDLSLDCIEKLDFSYNCLDREGSEALLSRLEPSRLIELKLASTGHSVMREVALFFEQRDPYNLQTLDLSYCNASDDDIIQLVRSLQHANQLQCLEINGNKVSSSATLSEIYQLPINRLSMSGVEISGVQAQPPVLQFSCLSLVPQPWGHRGPFGLITTDTTAK